VFRRSAKRLALGCLIVALGSSAEGQYFGRNKVRYRTFDFQVLQTEPRKSTSRGRSSGPEADGYPALT